MLERDNRELRAALLTMETVWTKQIKRAVEDMREACTQTIPKAMEALGKRSLVGKDGRLAPFSQNPHPKLPSNEEHYVTIDLKMTKTPPK